MYLLIKVGKMDTDRMLRDQIVYKLFWTYENSFRSDTFLQNLLLLAKNGRQAVRLKISRLNV